MIRYAKVQRLEISRGVRIIISSSRNNGGLVEVTVTVIITLMLSLLLLDAGKITEGKASYGGKGEDVRVVVLMVLVKMTVEVVSSVHAALANKLHKQKPSNQEQYLTFSSIN